jgi:ATP-binding cassette subfamily B multidrug efflux pump
MRKYLALIKGGFLEGIAYKDTNYILKCGLVLIGLAVFGYLFALVCQWYNQLL